VRRLAISIGIAVEVAWLGTPAFADAPPAVDVHRSYGGSAVEFHVSAGAPEDNGVSTTSAVGGSVGSSGPTLYPVQYPVIVVQAGTPCLTYTTTWITSQGTAGTLNAVNERQAEALQRQWPLCKGAPAAPGPGGLPPGQVAASFWESEGSNPLLVPSPKIEPGWAVTGKTAYLETGGRTAQGFQDPTGAGPLEIQASGQFWVDWGDGSGLQGPFDTTGGPYPDGTISHTWTATGTYTVQVFENWTAQWALGGQTGQLGGLRTVGEIPGFQVKELVSVRNR